jgi:hypothetical protein
VAASAEIKIQKLVVPVNFGLGRRRKLLTACRSLHLRSGPLGIEAIQLGANRLAAITGGHFTRAWIAATTFAVVASATR